MAVKGVESQSGVQGPFLSLPDACLAGVRTPVMVDYLST